MKGPEIYRGRLVTVHVRSALGGQRPWRGTITAVDEIGFELAGTWRFSQEREENQHRIYIPWTSVGYVEVT